MHGVRRFFFNAQLHPIAFATRSRLRIRPAYETRADRNDGRDAPQKEVARGEGSGRETAVSKPPPSHFPLPPFSSHPPTLLLRSSASPPLLCQSAAHASPAPALAYPGTSPCAAVCPLFVPAHRPRRDNVRETVQRGREGGRCSDARHLPLDPVHTHPTPRAPPRQHTASTLPLRCQRTFADQAAPGPLLRHARLTHAARGAPTFACTDGR
ncbi:hypothetical protein PLICRDRAFT_174803 [Plicaturopsis crispa FD-325 SS-3]|nr:hypothetical protein PLICRDRAFT_174803 [Plicaturopsis crispa FD-325 SS-3]